MSVSSTQNRVSYAGNGVTTVFSFPYYFLANADLVVIERDNTTGVEVTKTLTTDYTISGAGNPAGGSVTMLAAPASGKTLVIYRDPAPTQGLDLVDNDPFPAEEVEKALDRNIMVSQRLKDRVDRSVTLSEGFSTTFDPKLPALLEADRALILNPAADGFALGPTADEVANAQSYAQAALASQNAAAVSAANALTSENNAATSESNAATSAANALTSETNAATSESNAATSESNAATSAANALASENNAAASEGAAAASEANAAGSESNAATSESNALDSKNDAEAAALAAQAAVALITYPAREGMLLKQDSESPCLVKTGAGTLSVKAGTAMVVNNVFVDFTTQTAVVMPTLNVGTDYAVYICDDGTIRADANFSVPSGYTTTNSKKIGGFHYGLVGASETVAGGSFAVSGPMVWTQTDVDNIKGINQFSIWDLKFRPKCADPRGMVLVADSFWVDIYFCNSNPQVNGTSKYNSDVASGTVPAKIPTVFGGNGSTDYGSLTWWEANEMVKAFGKRLLSNAEFSVAAYGVTENQSIGTGAVSTTTGQALGSGSATPAFTGRVAGYTSKWGLEQASGNEWTWGADSAGAQGNGWLNVNDGRGQVYGISNASPIYVLLGGNRGNTSDSGSRCSAWSYYPWYSNWGIGVRAACDHLKLV